MLWSYIYILTHINKMKNIDGICILYYIYSVQNITLFLFVLQVYLCCWLEPMTPEEEPVQRRVSIFNFFILNWVRTYLYMCFIPVDCISMVVYVFFSGCNNTAALLITTNIATNTCDIDYKLHTIVHIYVYYTYIIKIYQLFSTLCYSA